MILLVLVPDDEAGFAKPVDKLHRAVMADAQALGKVADRHRAAARKALDCQQRLMLARGEARSIGLCLAEFQEASDQITKL